MFGYHGGVDSWQYSWHEGWGNRVDVAWVGDVLLCSAMGVSGQGGQTDRMADRVGDSGLRLAILNKREKERENVISKKGG